MRVFRLCLPKQIKNTNILKRNASNCKVRVRFAPSPTGLLHLGGLRTALYNHLFAKSQNGMTILRIEDTDQSRKVDSATENLIKDLAWCGIHYDEGPYFQSERNELYQKYAKQLLIQGDAYYCFCSSMRLDLIKREALKAGQIPKYDNKCRFLSKEEIETKMKTDVTPCVRFKLSNTTEPVNDVIHGSMIYDVALTEGDPVILKGDGFPTYHFANVVDDHFMNISHVLRGEEWQMSTAKHLMLYRALKWEPPVYAHLPLLLNADGKKLSKRQEGIQVKVMRESGILPNAVLNFVVRFGGGFNIDQKEKNMKSFTFEELIEKFDLNRILPNSSKINLKLLNDCNQLEMKRLLQTENGTKTLIRTTQEIVKKRFENSAVEKSLQLDNEHVKRILNTMIYRISKLEELVSKNFQYLWIWENNWKPKDPTSAKAVENFCSELKENKIDWTEEDLKKFFKTFVERNNLEWPSFMKTLRVILIGSEVGPSVTELMQVLGERDTCFRLQTAVKAKAENAHS